MKRPLRAITGISLLICLMTGCGTSRQMTMVTEDATVSAKVKVRILATDEHESYNGTLKLKLNERLRLSMLVPVTRTEAVRVELTPQRLLVIDRINRKYADLTLDEVNRHLGWNITFADVQNRIFGEGYPYLPASKKVIVNVTQTEVRFQFDLNNIKVAIADLPGSKLPTGYDRLTWDEIKEVLAQ